MSMNDGQEARTMTMEERCAVADWAEGASHIDFTVETEKAVQHLRRCPPVHRTAQDFGFLAGLTLGQLLEFDRKSRDDPARGHSVQHLMQDLYTVIDDWTILTPQAAGFFLASVAPIELYILIMCWPRQYLAKRSFAIGVLMGLHIARAEGTLFLRDSAEISEMLLDMVDQARELLGSGRQHRG